MNRESINRYIKREHARTCELESHADCGVDKLKDINGGYILVDNGDGAKIKKWGFLNIPEPKLGDLTKIAPEEVDGEKNDSTVSDYAKMDFGPYSQISNCLRKSSQS